MHKYVCALCIYTCAGVRFVNLKVDTRWCIRLQHAGHGIGSADRNSAFLDNDLTSIKQSRVGSGCLANGPSSPFPISQICINSRNQKSDMSVFPIKLHAHTCRTPLAKTIFLRRCVDSNKYDLRGTHCFLDIRGEKQILPANLLHDFIESRLIYWELVGIPSINSLQIFRTIVSGKAVDKDAKISKSKFDQTYRLVHVAHCHPQAGF